LRDDLGGNIARATSRDDQEALGVIVLEKSTEQIGDVNRGYPSSLPWLRVEGY